MGSSLNHDCIRDIMLYMEAHTTYENPYIWISQIAEGLSPTYEFSCVDYHCRMMDRAGLMASHCYSGNDGEYSGLSWEGHNYLNNIKDAAVWFEVKKATKGLEGVSVDVVNTLAQKVALSFCEARLQDNE